MRYRSGVVFIIVMHMVAYALQGWCLIDDRATSDIVFDDFEQEELVWETYQDCLVSPESELAAEGTRSMKWSTRISRGRHGIRGVWRAGLKLPLPERISFRLYPQNPYLFISVGDTDGTVAGKFYIPGLIERQWNSVTLSMDDMLTMGQQDQPLKNLITK